MPRFSQDRNTHLLTLKECAEAFRVSRSTIKRALKSSEVYVETHHVKRLSGRGATKTRFIDPGTLASILESSEGQVQRVTESSEGQVQRATESSEGQVQRVTESSEGQAEIKRLERPEPTSIEEFSKSSEGQVQRVTESSEGQVQRVISKKHENSEGQAQRVNSKNHENKKEEPRPLARKGCKARKDRGKFRIPPTAYDLIVRGLVSNFVTTSTAMIHRTLMRAVPDAMTYERAGHHSTVSIATVQRVKNALLDDPHLRLLFHNADKRKEHIRTYAGEVFSAHANDMWQMDMTRCDVMVIDLETGETFRPRIHAIIDVYSGCIPGLAFSREEDQAQTDLALLRALLPKTGPYAEKYPIYGIPLRMYWDNGKTYKSEHAARILTGLGVEDLHSRPRVSHTRGKIERFFGTFHQSFERALPGYVGEDAKARASEEIKRLTKNTRKWLEHGRDPGYEDRLLSITEYQNYVLGWLVAEYHNWVVNGLTRLEHFVQTAPERSRALIDKDELMLLFAERRVRTVEPGGTIRLDNQRYAIPDGTLINYQGRPVLALRDQFTAGDSLLIAYEERTGRITVLGEAVAAPTLADSLEAGELRRQSKAQAQAAQRRTKEQKRDLTDPELRVTRQLMKEARVVIEPSLPAAPKGRLAAVNPKDPREDLDPDDPFTQFVLRKDLERSQMSPGATPQERVKQILSRRGGGKS